MAVRDEDGTTYLLVKRSSDAWLVRDPETGDERYVEADRLEPGDDVSPLDAAAGGVDEPVRRLFALVHDERSLGLLIELADRGPLAVRALLADYDFCESDLHGRLASWRASGLIEDVDVHGERGYRVTDACGRGLAALRRTSVEPPASGNGAVPPNGASSSDDEATSPGRDGHDRTNGDEREGRDGRDER